MHRLSASLLLIVGLLVFGRPSFAQAGPKGPAPPEVREQVERGQAAYALGHFKEALDHFERAYRTYPAPEILYNVAQCLRQLDQLERALFLYERYLSLAPDTP